MIVDNEDGGLNIKFSREDLVAMSPSDFQLLKLFVEALTEECEKEEVDDAAHSQTDSRPVRRNDQIPPGRLSTFRAIKFGAIMPIEPRNIAMGYDLRLSVEPDEHYISADTGRPAVSSTTRMEQNDREAD